MWHQTKFTHPPVYSLYYILISLLTSVFLYILLYFKLIWYHMPFI